MQPFRRVGYPTITTTLLGTGIPMGKRPPDTPDTDQPAYLTPVVYHTLLALSDAPLHGYAISQEVMRATDARVFMGPGTLYGTLQRLHDAGWVERTDEVNAIGPHAERRRYYRLTTVGQSVLRGEARRLAHAADLARAHAILDGS